MFVCLGNICRSPLAEASFRSVVREAGLEDHFEISSSGTGHWHVGEMADRRMRATAGALGLDIESHRAQQFSPRHLEEYDHIFVMDKQNLNDVLYLDRAELYGNKVRLFREFDPEPDDFQVPDPFFGGPEGFRTVCEIVDRTARMIAARLTEEYRLNGKASR